MVYAFRRKVNYSPIQWRPSSHKKLRWSNLFRVLFSNVNWTDSNFVEWTVNLSSKFLPLLMTCLCDVFDIYRLSQAYLEMGITLYVAALPDRPIFPRKSVTFTLVFNVYLFDTQSDNDNSIWINVYTHTNLTKIINALWTTSGKKQQVI